NGTGLTASATAIVTVSAFNDAPVNRVPRSASLFRNGTLAFTGVSRVSVSDVDAGGGAGEVNLKAADGALRPGEGAAGGATLGNGTSSLSLTGPQSALNQALAGLSFRAAAGYAGAARVTMTTDDLGNKPGPARTDTDSVALTVFNRRPALRSTTPLAYRMT